MHMPVMFNVHHYLYIYQSKCMPLSTQRYMTMLYHSIYSVIVF